MSCSNNITPCGCGNNPCGCGTSSNDVVYQGPDLSCTGVTNCDTLTEVIQTIDGFICSPEMVENIINNILNNPNLYNQFTSIVNNTVDCETVWDCIDSRTTTTTSSSSTSTSTSTSTTTSTTTIPPTTTTTTTIVNFAHGFSEGKEDNNLACAETVIAITLYTSVPTIVFGTFMYTDPGLTTPFIGGVLYYKNISVNNGIRTGGTGQVSTLFSC